MTVIDAHHHFWKTAAQAQPWRTHAHTALERDFEPADLDPELDNAGIDATVVMQSVDEPAENVRLASYARHDRVAGVVAWLPIRDTRAALAELDRLMIDKLVGVRCLIADDPLDWITQPNAVTLFREVADRGLSWDVVPITAAQTRHVIALAEEVPELRIIIDHLGRPPIDTLGWDPWAANIAELAQNPDVAVKVSVGIDALTAWGAWKYSELEKYVDHVAALFGAQRLMLASNWPVVLLRADYATAWADLSALVAHAFPDHEDQGRISGGTATTWYRLSPPHVPSGNDEKSKKEESGR
ncbi:amidohydrolase family protein [Gryllotalpicola reticulitermitis]|uniref:Amidohydrolase family protein n=1 Tax=Gryllotalpicola reticulitermitis TaxID=1184153 RepID=A0ABV8QD55_9MICO